MTKIPNNYVYVSREQQTPVLMNTPGELIGRVRQGGEGWGTWEGEEVGVCISATVCDRQM